MAHGKNEQTVSSLREKENSPFTPGNPVPVEFFVGRSSYIEELRRYARQACSGRLENVFLSGDRGIGKSSLARFVRELCFKEWNMLGIHVFLGGVTTLEEMVRRVFDQLLKETHTQAWFNKIQGLFGQFIKNVGLFGISVEFAPPKEHLKGLVHQFSTALTNVFRKIKDERRGLLLILDDINGLTDRPAFANWYKSFVDSVATHDYEFPVLIMLCGLPERRDSLSNLQPSLMRIFRVVDVEKLEDPEVEHFLTQAFQTVKIEVAQDAMAVMVKYCNGLPTLMHEIGDATYWADTDGVVDREDAYAGIIAAAEKVGQKYLDPSVYRAIRSDRYKAILGKIVSEGPSVSFNKREIGAKLSDAEKTVLDNFLRKMRELGVIESDRERGRGAYRFVNWVFPLYIYMQSGAGRR